MPLIPTPDQFPTWQDWADHVVDLLTNANDTGTTAGPTISTPPPLLKVLRAASGSYQFAGHDAGLQKGPFHYVLDALLGEYALTGHAATMQRLTQAAQLSAQSGLFKLTGNQADLSYATALPVQGSTVTTFHSISLYWTPVDANGVAVTPIANPANPGWGPAVAVRYAKASGSAWKRGLDMWYDSRDTTSGDGTSGNDGNLYGRKPEARGSIMFCDSGTQYIVQFGLYDAQGNITWIAENKPITWSELGDPIPSGGYGPVEGTRITAIPAVSNFNFKGGHSGTVSQARLLNVSGTPTGWTLYDFTGQTVDDSANSSHAVFVIDGSYIILRGVTTKGGNMPVMIQPGSHDILIEECDFSGWANNPANQSFTINGVTYQGGISSSASEMNNGITLPGQSFGTSADFLATKRFIIQKNKFHNPRYGANPWDFGHPQGPSPIQLYPNGGNHVIRYNECYSTLDGTREGTLDHGHQHNDGIITGGDNQSVGGIGPDVDIYKNFIRGAMDDSCELDGGGMNNRFWSNYADYTNTGLSATPTFLGPAYIAYNVYNRSRELYNQPYGAETDRTQHMKCGGIQPPGNGGRRYIFHNTSMQLPWQDDPEAAGPNNLGGWHFIAGTGGNPLENTISMNNVCDTIGGAFVDTSAGVSGCVFDYDMCSNGFAVTETHGKANSPASYQAGNGPTAYGNGKYRLNAGTPGYGDAAVLPNINDSYTSPDRGAAQHVDPDIVYGLNATGF